MSEKATGGSAFPETTTNAGCTEYGQQYSNTYSYGGMTLRDYFAAKFAHAEMVTAGALPDPARDLIAAASRANRTIEQQVAFNAYKLADAMIAERAK